MVKFPEGFIWGTATSSYQVEGENSGSDWWQWELKNNREPSGQACLHYKLFEEDFALVSHLHNNAHRFSIEWSRIQPEKDVFSEDQIRHYIEVINSLRAKNIRPCVTLHHFTNPSWFSSLGGWEDPGSVGLFLKYVERIADTLSDKVDFWITINEPMVYVYFSYMKGDWPPQVRCPQRAGRVKNNLIRAHIESYRLIHKIYDKKRLTSPSVGIAQNMIAFVPCTNSFRDRLAVYLRNRFFNRATLDTFLRSRALDYIGINYYTRHLIHTQRWSVKDLLFDVCGKNHDTLSKNSMGWEIYPRGLYDLLMMLKSYGMPVYILENGVCADDDSLRKDFIVSHLKALHQAISEGVDVKGYFYWSLLDNFEWDKGFGPRFGLYEVDYRTFKRNMRESAKMFSGICRDNGLT